jgi:hypothetical protein
MHQNVIVFFLSEIQSGIVNFQTADRDVFFKSLPCLTTFLLQTYIYSIVFEDKSIMNFSSLENILFSVSKGKFVIISFCVKYFI